MSPLKSAVIGFEMSMTTLFVRSPAPHSVLAKRPKKNKPPRRAARRSHRLSNCAKVNLSGVRAAGRFFAMARVGSAAGLLAVVTIAV